MNALEQKKTLESGATVKPFTIAGNGKQVRDVLYASDLINLYNSAFENGRSCSGSIFNIGGGISNSLSLLELFKYLEEVLEINLSFDQLLLGASTFKEQDLGVCVLAVPTVMNGVAQWCQTAACPVVFIAK